MAKIKYSALVSDVRNKLNGSVMSKNRYGSYMRNKITPVNPQTQYQQNARMILSSLSSGWAGLSESERAGWNALASQVPFTDIFGDVQHLSGQVMYVKLNANLIKIAEAPNSTAPVMESIPPMLLDGLDAEQTAGALVTLDAEFVQQTVPAGYQIVIYATPPIKPGISFVKNQYRMIGAIDTITSGVANALTLWNDRFGAVTAGQKIFLRAALVNETTGQQGIPSQAEAVITTA